MYHGTPLDAANMIFADGYRVSPATHNWGGHSHTGMFGITGGDEGAKLCHCIDRAKVMNSTESVKRNCICDG